MSSWIFLLISALLIVSGLFLCNYARSLAPNDAAIDGNITSEDGQSLVELDYSDLNISTISLALENCQVELHGGADEAKVELIGFSPNTYINSVSNKTLRVSNQISLLDYLNFDGSGVTFSGVWQTLLSFMQETETVAEPTVIIYVPDDFDIKNYSLSFTDCSVRVLGIGGEEGECDLALYTNNSSLEFNKVNASMVDFECEESELSVLDSTFFHFDVKSEGGSFESNALKSEDITISGDEGDFTMLKSDFREFSFEMESADIRLNSIYTQGSYQRDLSVKKGEIYLGDLLIGTEDSSPEDETAPGSLLITLENGEITMGYGSETLPLPEDETPSEDNAPSDENSSENGENSSEDET